WRSRTGRLPRFTALIHLGTGGVALPRASCRFPKPTYSFFTGATILLTTRCWRATETQTPSRLPGWGAPSSAFGRRATKSLQRSDFLTRGRRERSLFPIVLRRRSLTQPSVNPRSRGEPTASLQLR